MYFIDTNILIYAHDESDPRKNRLARTLLIDLINTQKACISTQVVQEFCNVALKKSANPLRPDHIRQILRELLLPLVAHQPDASFYLRALSTYERYSLSLYDALIVQAAIDLKCTTLYSEDLQHNAHYGATVKVINPFVTS